MTRPRPWRTLSILLACSALLAILGCGPKVDQEAFAKISNDMPEAEVFAILGEPDDSSSFSLGGLSATSATWEGRGGTIAIQFVNGKVALKTFTSESRAGSD